MPKAHGFSPAQLLFGRSQNMLLPQPASAFSPIEFKEAALARDQLFISQAGHCNRDKARGWEFSHQLKVKIWTILILLLLHCICLWYIFRNKRTACSIFVLGSMPGPGSCCKGKTDKEKLEEFKKMAKLYRDHTTENSINQSNSGVSLFNFQWASFASGASALGVVALICGLIILCCLWKAKAGIRRRKNQEGLLKAISTISSPATTAIESSSPATGSSVSTTAPAPIAGSDWIRTPTGWTSIPSSYSSGSGGIPVPPVPATAI